MQRFFFLTLFLFALPFAQEPQEQRSEADKRAEILGTVHVSRMQALDPAKGTYKSPRRAMFMSLILPGSGQIYVGGKQARYVRGIFYLAEEIALISGFYYYSIHKYNDQVKKYQDFAKKNFSVNRYEAAMNDLYDPEFLNFRDLYGKERENYCEAFFGSSGSLPCIENFGKTSGSPNDDTPIYSPSTYYSVIANKDFILGWLDSEKNSDTDLGTSKHYNNYLSLRKKASNLADRQVIFLSAIILNHVVSAIDAALSASAHNNSLYEEKLSFLDKIRLESNFNAGENFKAEAAVVYAF